MRTAITSLVLIVGCADLPAVAQQSETRLARAPSDMSGAEIDAYNKGRRASDPAYIRRRANRAGRFAGQEIAHLPQQRGMEARRR